MGMQTERTAEPEKVCPGWQILGVALGMGNTLERNKKSMTPLALHRYLRETQLKSAKIKEVDCAEKVIAISMQSTEIYREDVSCLLGVPVSFSWPP